MTDWFALVGTHVWQVTLTAIVLLAIAWVVGRTRPQAAYLLCVVVILKCLVPPVVSTSIGVFCWMTSREDANVPVADSSPVAVDVENPAAENSSDVTSAVASDSSRARASAFDWRLAPAVLWVAGVVAICGVIVVRHRRLRQLLAKPGAWDDVALRTQLERLSRRLSLRPVEHLVLDADTTPFVMGLRRPTIVLPTSWCTCGGATCGSAGCSCWSRCCGGFTRSCGGCSGNCDGIAS